MPFRRADGTKEGVGVINVIFGRLVCAVEDEFPHAHDHS
jgi:hypothetical protein